MATSKLVGHDDATGASSASGYFRWGKFTAIATGSMTEFRLKAGVNANVRVALYSDNAGQPGTLLNSVASTGVVIGWNTITFPSTDIVSGTTYWLAHITETTGGVQYVTETGTGNSAYKVGTFYDAWPTSGWIVADNFSHLVAGWGTPYEVILPSSIVQATAVGEPTVTMGTPIILYPSSIVQAIAVGMPTLQLVEPPVPDLQDWMDSVNIVAARLNLPMFIKGTDVNLPIDIKALTVGTISVDVVAQAVGNLLISVAAQSVGVYLQPEWAASQGTDKNFYGAAPGLSFLGYAYAAYTVPTGKKLFISSISGSLRADLAANGDLNQMCFVGIYNHDTGLYIVQLGGNGGAGMNFPKPIVIAAGTTVWFITGCLANHSCTANVAANGYEV